VLMTNRTKVTLGIVTLITALIFLFRYQIEGGLECLAYYDQCTATRIEGLTKEECFSRDDASSYLIDAEICLVK